MNLRPHAHRIGAICYVLWGMLHIVVGVIPVFVFFSGGPASMLASLEGAQAVPEVVDEPLLQAAYFVAEHHFNLAAFGVLAIWIGVTLNWENDPLGFWINLVVLGMVDLSFILGQIVPGYMPVLIGGIGPVLYLLGAGFTGLGLTAQKRSTRDVAASPGGESS